MAPALITVLQFMEELPDRQATDAVRGRIDWKYLLGLELADPIQRMFLGKERLSISWKTKDVSTWADWVGRSDPIRGTLDDGRLGSDL